MRVIFRHIGATSVPTDNWATHVEWPDYLRVPVVGEMVSLIRGQYTVSRVQWFVNYDKSGSNGVFPELIVR